jgi:hypothetical protein
MVSDILFEAINDITEYKRRMPDIYINDPEIAERLEYCLEIMRGTMDFLDVHFPIDYLKNEKPGRKWHD